MSAPIDAALDLIDSRLRELEFKLRARNFNESARELWNQIVKVSSDAIKSGSLKVCLFEIFCLNFFVFLKDARMWLINSPIELFG